MLRINDITQVWLGIQGENQARTIEIDVSDWVEDFPDAGFSVWMKAPGGTVPQATGASYVTADQKIVWSPSSTDTYVAGEGEAEIRLSEGNVVKKTKKIRVGISGSVTGGGSALGADWQAYINEADRIRGLAVAAQLAAEQAQSMAETAAEETEGAADMASQSATAAAGSASAAASSASAATTKADEASQSATAAAGSASAAASSATAASNSKDTAVSAKTAAETAASNATGAATAAETAQGEAENAQAAAEQAQAAAEQAAQDAQETVQDVVDDIADLKSAFNESPVDAHETNFAELTSADLNPLTTLKEIDKNYKQFNGKFVNASLNFTDNANYTTYVIRLPFYGFKITCAAAKIFVAKSMPTGTAGEHLDVEATVTTSGSSGTEYTLNYSKGSIIVFVVNTQGVDPNNLVWKTRSGVPYTEPRLKLLPIQNEFNFYAKKDTTISTSDANSALGIIVYHGKLLAATSGNVSDNASYNTYSFQVPTDSITITCPNGFRCTKSYFAPGVYASNQNLIELVYERDTGRVETFTAKYKEWVSISVNMNANPNGLDMRTNLSHPFTLPGLQLSVGQSQAFYKFAQSSYASGSQRKLSVHFKSGNKVVQWNLYNTRPNTGWTDTWQLEYVKGYDFDGEKLSNEVILVKNGEYEIAFKENGAPDYCGGANHGDEKTNVFILFIDGKQITDLSSLDSDLNVFNRIDAFEIATIYRAETLDTDNPVPLITHQKRWVFENGKVTVNETIKTLVDLSVDGMLCCMFPAMRSAYTYGIRQGKVAIEDLTTSTYEKIFTTENEISYLMYGEHCTARITSKLCDHTPTGQMWINPTSDLNKLYYGFWGTTDSGHPVSIPANTVVWWENEYDVAYN